MSFKDATANRVAEYERDTPPMPIWIAIVIWIVALVVLIIAQAGFSAIQMNDEPPTYTCAPGTQYTTKECE